MTPKKVNESQALAWLNGDHPEASDGPGFYELNADNDDDHTNAKFGKKLAWVKSKADKEGEPADPENNKGYYVYADSVDEE